MRPINIPAMQTILAHLPATSRMLQRSTGLTENTIRQALDRLTAAGAVGREIVAREGRQYRYVRIREVTLRADSTKQFDARGLESVW